MVTTMHRHHLYRIGFLVSSLLLAACTGPMLPVALVPHDPALGVSAPIRFIADAPHISVQINGNAPQTVLLDTGASVSVFEGDVADANGITPIPNRTTQIRGIHGNASATQAVIRSLDIGPWHNSSVGCYIRTGGARRVSGLGDAILGIDLLQRHCSYVSFDYAAGRAEIALRYSYQPAGGWVTRVPFRMVNGLPMIQVSAGGLSWDAVVDTGSSWGIVIDQATASKLGQSSGGEGLGGSMVLSGVGGAVSARSAGARIIEVGSVDLCGVTMPTAEVYVMPGPKRIGSKFWEGSRMTLDFRTSTLWWER